LNFGGWIGRKSLISEKRKASSGGERGLSKPKKNGFKINPYRQLISQPVVL
jgi:hypothetical protein